MPKRAVSDIYLTERAPIETVPRCADGPFLKKLLLKRALSDIHLPDRAHTETIKTGTSKKKKKKMLPQRALSDCVIYLTERAPTEAADVKTADSRRPIPKTTKFEAAYAGNVFGFCWISGETVPRNT